MLVRDVMNLPVLTVAPDATLQAAYRLLQEQGIRHLPVVEGGALVGVVTDRDLRLATSSLSPDPFPPDARIDSVMRRDPWTADPGDPVEDAARVMRERKIGCLPVLEDGRLAGILTGLDLLDALMRMTGVDKPSGRLEVRLPDHPGELARLTAFLSGRGVDVHSVLTYPEDRASVRTVLRVGTMEVRPLAQDLRRDGFEILWPAEKPCPR